MNKKEPEFKPVRILKKVHSEIKRLGAMNDVKMRDLATRLLIYALANEEVTDEIIRDLRKS